MPLPVSVVRMNKTLRRPPGLLAKRFLFWFIFDFNSYLARKNPFAVIRAFQKAFAAADQSGAQDHEQQARDAGWREFTSQCPPDARGPERRPALTGPGSCQSRLTRFFHQ